MSLILRGNTTAFSREHDAFLRIIYPYLLRLKATCKIKFYPTYEAHGKLTLAGRTVLPAFDSWVVSPITCTGDGMQCDHNI